MAPAGAQIAGPAGPAIGLRVDVAVFKEAAPAHGIQTVARSHLERRIADGAMARVPASPGGYRKIATASAAWVRRASTAMDLLERDREIRQSHGQALPEPRQLGARRPDQFVQIDCPIRVPQCPYLIWRAAERWDAGLWEAEIHKGPQPRRHVHIVTRHRRTGREFGLTRLRQQLAYASCC